MSLMAKSIKIIGKPICFKGNPLAAVICNRIRGSAIISPTPPNCRTPLWPNENMPKCKRLGVVTRTAAGDITIHSLDARST